MPKVDLSDNEITELCNALDASIKSAKRAQNTGKNPQIKEIWATHERFATQLMHRLASIPQNAK